ncbi:MAG: hypothetical protein ACRCWI_03395 [Brevinema sp.]
MKKTLIIFSVLLLLGARPTLSDGVRGTGDAVLDTGIKDALNQIGSTQGLTQWTFEGSGSKVSEVLDLSFKSIVILFLGKDVFKEIHVISQDGTTIECDGEISVFKNEIVSLSTVEGILSSSSNFKITRVNDNTRDFVSKGYTHIYTQSPKKTMYWGSKKIGGSGIWEELPYFTPYSYITKETTTERSLIQVYKTLTNNVYSINETAEDTLKNHATNFIKQ